MRVVLNVDLLKILAAQLLTHTAWSGSMRSEIYLCFRILKLAFLIKIGHFWLWWFSLRFDGQGHKPRTSPIDAPNDPIKNPLDRNSSFDVWKRIVRHFESAHLSWWYGTIPESFHIPLKPKFPTYRSMLTQNVRPKTMTESVRSPKDSPKHLSILKFIFSILKWTFLSSRLL